ncbi:response regulator [Corynebacterium halotolerans]|uniref:response regulator n=1 Tax=Corynebacterium halotolerans TaxID=225326 RepID=UPI003CFA166F
MSGAQPAISVLVVDDEQFFRETVTTYLQQHPEITVIATAGDGLEALAVLERVAVDVVLSDVRMPRLDGIGLTQEMSDRALQSRVVGLTTFDDDRAMLGMLSAGAFGFVLKSARPEEIVGAVRTAAAGGTTISPQSATSLRKYVTNCFGPATVALPGSEQRVLALLQTGRSNAEIARELGVAETTVKKSVARLMRRYDVKSRLELVVATREH